MTVWVLFVWMTTSLPGSWTFETKAECEEARAPYKQAACVKVVVPRK
jgi:hypothetical protein